MLINPSPLERKLSGKGFTLLEVLFSAAIFAFAAAGVIQLYIRCTLLDQANRNKSIATTHAETALEYIKSQTFSTLQTNLCTSGLAPVPQPWSLDLGQGTLNLEGITGAETINATTTSACCSSMPLNWLEITVSVGWKDSVQTNARTLTLATAISK